MHEFLLIIPKTLFSYFMLILVMKIMGKREVGQLSIFDVAVFFIISDMFSLSIEGELSVIIKTTIATITIVIMQLLTAKLILKYSKLRNVVDGTPTLIINDGVIDQKAMRGQNYNIDDLFTQLREKDLNDIDNIKYVILETSGNLSIVKYDDNLLFPFPFIKDGKVDEDSLNLYGKDIEWLNKQIGENRIEDIFIALLKRDGMYIVRMESF